MMTRRDFLAWPAALGACAVLPQAVVPRSAGASAPSPATALTLLLSGDVMTGRGIDQVMRHPGDPQLHESWVRSARDYVRLAESAHGPIPRPVEPDYIWGEALAAIDAHRPALRIVNLETAVTTANQPWPDKGIHYRMHPDNVTCLSAAKLDACVLANNHVLDWGRPGLAQTLATLHAAGLRTAGAGRDEEEAWRPAVFELAGGRTLLLFAMAAGSSGVPRDWQASERQSGVALLPDLSRRTVEAIAARVAAARAARVAGCDTKHRSAAGAEDGTEQGAESAAPPRIGCDAGRHNQARAIVIVSLHWGDNWGYAVHGDERAFAHALIEHAGVDVVHGHSSHHPRPIEVHAGKLILYGCGDLINDYEGISGYEAYRGDLSLAYLPSLDAGTGRLLELALLPLQMHRFRLRRPSPVDRQWLLESLNRECATFGTSFAATAQGWLGITIAHAPDCAPPARR